MQVSLEVLGNFSSKTMKRRFVDEELRVVLVTTDFTLRNGSRLLRPPEACALLRAIWVTNCLRDALPPVILRYEISEQHKLMT